jgi:hypothetical protein
MVFWSQGEAKCLLRHAVYHQRIMDANLYSHVENQARLSPNRNAYSTTDWRNFQRCKPQVPKAASNSAGQA